jgi:GT2 family glycosyltransferase
MARWVGEVKQGISGKFDLIRREVFQRIGGYDTQTFSFAGEDMDLFMRLSQQGEVFVAPTRVLHLHNQTRKTRWTELFSKPYQLAESFGALVRKWGLGLRQAAYSQHWLHHLFKFLYPLLLLLPVAPVPIGLALLVLTNVAYWDVWKVKSPRILVMLALNPLIFLACALATAKGFITGKQRYSFNK